MVLFCFIWSCRFGISGPREKRVHVTISSPHLFKTFQIVCKDHILLYSDLSCTNSDLGEDLGQSHSSNSLTILSINTQPCTFTFFVQSA